MAIKMFFVFAIMGFNGDHGFLLPIMGFLRSDTGGWGHNVRYLK